MAVDGDELMELVERSHPEVVIVDISMPPTHTDGGLRAAKTIRQKWPTIGILVRSQHVNAHTPSNLVRRDRWSPMPP
jgi:DNA-binding NarL/FixJ family response regulator